MEKILLDTDIGSDIDDSVCLAYLLKHPECDLLGITTVSGQPTVRAMCASALCKAAGRDDIPIYPGVESSLMAPTKQPEAHQSRYLPLWPHETQFPQGEAIEFMRRTIRENPGEVTLLAIGPMTNVGLLFAVDPEIPALLKQLVLMCGVFSYQTSWGACLAEWNARNDPHATSIVYRAKTPKTVSIGLDVTSKVVMHREEVVQRFSNGLLKTVLDFSGITDGTRENIVFHDPLAATVIFDESLCRFERGNVSVETESHRLEGLTYWEPDENGYNQVAFEVDADRFFTHYLGVVNQ